MQIQNLARGVVGLVALASPWIPSSAHACQCDPSAILIPASESQSELNELALNAAPIIEGAFEPGSVTIEDELGQPIAATINEGPLSENDLCSTRWAEIIPEQPWQPRTAHTIRVKSLDPKNPTRKSLTFVTGVDTLPDSKLEVPKARVSVLNQVPARSTCSPEYVQTCLSVDGQTEHRRDIELIVRRGDEIRMRNLLWSDDANIGLFALPDCIELRRRSPTGKRSKPLMLCGDDLHVTEFRSGVEFKQSPICKDGKFDYELRSPAVGADNAESGPHAGSAGSQPSPADAEPASHREYGCEAVAGQPVSVTPARYLLLVAIVLFVLLPRRRRRERD